MSNATLTKIVSALLALGVTVAGWWANRIQTSIDTLTTAVTELQVRAKYVSGNIPAAPITTDVKK